MNYLGYWKNDNLSYHQFSWEVDRRIVAINQLSLCSGYSWSEIKDQIVSIKNLEFEWDRPVSESCREATYHLVEEIISAIPSAIFRVRDKGAAYFLKGQFPQTKIKIYLDFQHRNISGALVLKNYFHSSLYGFILPVEINHLAIDKWFEDLGIDLEILGYGPVLLSIIPRRLSWPVKSGAIFAIDSQERGYGDFVVQRQNDYSLIFSPFILNRVERLSLTKISDCRIDDRFDLSLFKEDVSSVYQDQEMDFLKRNHLIPPASLKECAEVVDVSAKDFLLLAMNYAGERLAIGDQIVIYTPDGNTHELKLSSLKTLAQQEVGETREDKYYLIPWHRGVSARSKVYRKM